MDAIPKKKMLQPYGDLRFHQAFRGQIRLQGPSGDPHGILFGTYINGLV